MNMLRYPLYRGETVNRWLLAGIYEQKMRFEPVTMSGDVNLWLKEGFSIHENPCRREYVEERRSSSADLPDFSGIQAGAKLHLPEGEREWRLYFPFDNANVELSAFWFVPTSLRTWAYTVLDSSDAHRAPFRLKTCGGATVWINGEKAAEFSPYTRNIEQAMSFEAELKGGANLLAVCLDDLAERDTQYYFRLDYHGAGQVEMALPVGSRSPETIQAAEEALYHARFPEDTVMEGDVRLLLRNPFRDELICAIEGGYEENLVEGGIRRLQAAIAPGSRETVLGRVEDFSMGFNHFSVTLKPEGIPITRILPLQVYPVSLVPEPAPELEERKRQALRFLAVHGEENINKAMAILYAGGDREEARQIILRQMEGINDRYDCSDFHLVHLYRLWSDFREQELYDEGFWDQVKACILSFRYWMDEPGDDVMWFFSENHALLFHTCQLLAGQLFPGEVFTNSGRTGAELQRRAEELLAGWFERFFEEGLTEWNCSAYIPIDVLGLANLYGMAASPSLRESARKALDKVFYYTAVNGFHGILSCSFGRSYEKELKGNYINGTSSMCWIGWGTGYMNQSGKAAVSLCLTDYAPPAEYAAYMSMPAGRSMVFRNTQGYMEHVDLYAYKTRDFMLSTACCFKPGRKGYQEHIVQAVLDPQAQIWINHPGELHAHGSGRPSFWAGNGYLPKAAQFKGLSVLLFDIHPDHAAHYTHAYFPVGCFDEVVQYGNWCFARKGAGFAAVYARNGLALQGRGLNRSRELVSPGLVNMWLLRMAGPEEFGSFEAFKDSMLQMKLAAGPNLQLRLQDAVYGQVEMSWDSPLTVNGKVISYKGYSTDGVIQYMDSERAK